MTDHVFDKLHGWLTTMRAELVERLAREGIEGGTLALLPGINAAIEACDAAMADHHDLARAPTASFWRMTGRRSLWRSTPGLTPLARYRCRRAARWSQVS
jgi:hypothetical protein